MAQGLIMEARGTLETWWTTRFSNASGSEISSSETSTLSASFSANSLASRGTDFARFAIPTKISSGHSLDLSTSFRIILATSSGL